MTRAEEIQKQILQLQSQLIVHTMHREAAIALFRANCWSDDGQAAQLQRDLIHVHVDHILDAESCLQRLVCERLLLGGGLI